MEARSGYGKRRRGRWREKVEEEDNRREKLGRAEAGPLGREREEREEKRDRVATRFYIFLLPLCFSFSSRIFRKGKNKKIK